MFEKSRSWQRYSGKPSKIVRVHLGHVPQLEPRPEDDRSALRIALEARSGSGFEIEYDRRHRVLADGNFVLAVSEGSLDGAHTSFYDLYRVAGGKLVEHWDTIETVPPRSEWKNDNGKF